jgi:hypothetical protein
MNRTFLTLALIIVCGGAAVAQTSETTGSGRARSATSVSKSGKSAQIESGTQVAAQLQNTLDARKARVGDRVVLKTTEAIKSNGQTVVGKGANLIGHVTEVQQRTSANGESRIGLLFDRLEKGSLDTPISATISSITQARVRTQSSNDDLFSSDMSASSRSNASVNRQPRSSSDNGGLLGGVGGTVGGVLNTTTSTVGTVASNTTTAVGSTVGAAGNTASGVTGSLGGLRIAQSSSASADGGALLSLQGSNLRLEQGTSFHLILSQSAAVGNNQ